MILKLINSMDRFLSRPFNTLIPLLDLGFRIYVAKAFFMSGLTKIKSWESTLMLFEYEYSVPLLPHNVAAILGTAAELILPVLLFLGLGTRLTALGLFIFNIVAVISYPDISAAGEWQHALWGAMLLVVMIYGPSKLTLDQLIGRVVSR